MMDTSFLYETTPFSALLSSSSTAALLLATTAIAVSPTIITSVQLGGVPAFFMFFFTLVGLKIKPEPLIVGALQHFAAGILLCTVAIELLPEIVQADNWQENLASSVGFFFGVAVLIGLGIVLPDNENEGVSSSDEVMAEITPLAAPDTNNNPSLRNRRRSLKAEAFACSYCQDSQLAECLMEESTEEGQQTLLVEAPAPLATSKLEEDWPLSLLKASEMQYSTTTTTLPTALLTAIAIDAMLDGLLIGIAIAAGPSTGPMLSASLSVEMSFLGLTLATALFGRGTRALLAAAIGPFSLLLGAFAGGSLAGTVLQDSPVLLEGLLGFGTSALLFMAAEELLLEAHEEGEHVWWVDLQLYIGFFVSIMVNKLVAA